MKSTLYMATPHFNTLKIGVCCSALFNHVLGGKKRGGNGNKVPILCSVSPNKQIVTILLY